MVTVQSFLKVADDLVPVAEFAGPVADEDYIEGAIELSVDRKPVVARQLVDYVDQLWAYLIRGLGEVVAGREFSTYYPDMPVKIVLQPQGDRVTIKLSSPSHKWDAEASVAIDELLRAMLPAGTLFFEKLQPHVTRADAYDREIADLAALGASRGR